MLRLLLLASFAPSAAAQLGPVVWSDQFGSESVDAAVAAHVDDIGVTWLLSSVEGVGPSARTSVRRYDGSGGLLSDGRFDLGFGTTAEYELVLDGAGGAYIGGWYRPGSAPMEMFLVRVDATGLPVWTRIFGTSESDQCHGIAQDGDGGAYLCGFWNGGLGAVNGNEDGYVARYDAQGNELWSRVFGTPQSDFPEDCVATGDGGVIVVGSTRGLFGGPPMGFQQGFAVCYDALGLEQWRRSFGSPGHDSAIGAASDRHGGCYVIGFTNDHFAAPLVGTTDLFVLRIDASGQELWRRQFGVAGDFVGAAAVAATPSGGCLVAARSRLPLVGPSVGGMDVHLLRLDDQGATVGGRVVASTRADEPGHVSFARDGSITICGYTAGDLFGRTPTVRDAWVARLASDGIGTTTCLPVTPNSIGASAFVRLYGSSYVEDDFLELRVRNLPNATFGFFLTSNMQGPPITPPGSAGTLCLSGAIGRFVGPGQVLSSGSIGGFDLIVEPNALPSPTGSVTAASGETYHFQTWYRDLGPGTASHFSSVASITFR